MGSARINQKLYSFATQIPTYVNKFAPLMKAYAASLLLHTFFGTAANCLPMGRVVGPVSNVVE